MSILSRDALNCSSLAETFALLQGQTQKQVLLASRSKTWVCSRSIAGAAGSDAAKYTDVRLLFVVQAAASATNLSLVQRYPVDVCLTDAI